MDGNQSTDESLRTLDDLLNNMCKERWPFQDVTASSENYRSGLGGYVINLRWNREGQILHTEKILLERLELDHPEVIREKVLMAFDELDKKM